jgi:hypothetical protein
VWVWQWWPATLNEICIMKHPIGIDIPLTWAYIVTVDGLESLHIFFWVRSEKCVDFAFP